MLLRNEYLAAENHILRAKIKGRLQLSDGEKPSLAEIARRLGRKALAEVAGVAKPDTILGWFRRLVAREFDGSRRGDSSDRAQALPPECMSNSNASRTLLKQNDAKRLEPRVRSLFLQFSAVLRWQASPDWRSRRLRGRPAFPTQANEGSARQVLPLPD